MNFTVTFSSGKFGKSFHLALYHDRAGLALQRFDAEQDRVVPAPAVQSSATSTPLPPVISMMRASGSSLLHVDHVVGAQRLGDFHPRAILGRAGDDDERGAGLLADHGLRQPLLAGPLDQHRGVVADAAVEQRPFDAVGHRRHQSGELRRDALRARGARPRSTAGRRSAQSRPTDAAPSRPRCSRSGCRRDCCASRCSRNGGTGPVAPLAFAAHDVVLDEHQVAFLEALAPGEFAPALAMMPMFSWPMITGRRGGGCAYSLTSVPQMPATSIFSSALSSGTSGIGYSRNSVLLGPVLTAACTFSTTAKASKNVQD